MIQIKLNIFIANIDGPDTLVETTVNKTTGNFIVWTK